jgi:hypothetical protein
MQEYILRSLNFNGIHGRILIYILFQDVRKQYVPPIYKK